MRPRIQDAGFTLVELLVATSIMALVGGTCVAVLTGGIRVWQRAVDHGTWDQSSLIAFEQMQRDLQNIRRFSPILADGRWNQFSFPAVDRIDPDGPEELGRLGYFVDYQQSVLCRAFVPYRAMGRSRLRDACQPILEGVTRLRLTYFGAKEGELDWSQTWESPEPPAAVKVSLMVSEGRQTRTHSFIVSLMSVAFDDES